MRRSLPPYLPRTGVNYDSESLAVGENDCLDILNLSIARHELKTRPGLSQVGQSTFWLETDTYTGAEAYALFIGSFYFAFTPTDQMPVVMKVTDAGGTTWTCTEDLDDNKLYDEDGFAVGMVNRGPGYINFATYPYPRRGGGIPYNPYYPVGNSTITFEYHKYSNYGYPFTDSETVLKMSFFRDPDAGETLFVFTDRGAYQYDDSGGDATATFSNVLDPTVTDFSGIQFWDTTEFTDSNLGATMVAAGSIPPASATTAESDGDSRVLLYWDRSTSTFKELAPRYESTEALYTFTGSETPPFDLGTAAVPPIDYDTVSVWWYEGSYKWILTCTSGGMLKDPDDNNCGSLVLATGEAQLNAWPQRGGGAYTYAPASGTDVTLEYETEVYMRPRFVFNMNNRLIMVNVFTHDWSTSTGDWDADGTYRPWRVAWSTLNDITKHDFTLDYSDNVGIDISPYVAGEYIGDLLILYRQSSIEQMFYVGGSAIFGFRTSVNEGLYAGSTVGLYRNLQFFLGKDNVYAYDGNSIRPLADDRIREHILSVAKSDSLDKFRAFVDGAKAEYWILVPTTTSWHPSRAYVYSILQDAWTVYEFPKKITAMQFKSEHFEKPLVGTDDGYVLKLDEDNHNDSWETWGGSSWSTSTNAIECMLETKDFVFGPLENLDRVQRVCFEAASDGDSGKVVGVSGSQDYGETYSIANQDISLDSEQKDRFYWIDTTARKLRLKFLAYVWISIRYIQISGLGKEEK